MATEIRETGIGILGEMPRGTHFCHFYETKEDLLDILIPYFKAGLENNEFCMWVVFDPLDAEEARKVLRRAVPGTDRHLAAGDIEIMPYSQWYLHDGAFDLKRVINGWKQKLAQALAKGYDGMRVNGNEAWLTEKDWQDFLTYEKHLNKLIARQRMIVLCTYPLALRQAAEIFDVARSHEFAIARRHGKWEVLETPELRQAKAEIKRLNEELEQKVDERTRELSATIAELREEVAERKRVEEQFRQSEERYRGLFDHMVEGFAYCKMIFEDGQPKDWIYLSVNEAFAALTGLKNVTGKRVTEVIPDIREADPELFEIYARVASTGKPERFEKFVHALQMWFTISVYSPETGFFVVVFDVITERKRTEEALQKSEGELRTLFAAMTDIVLVLDAEGRYLKIAPTNPLNLYRPSEELLGKTVHEILPEAEANEIHQQIERALANHQTINFEYKSNIGSKEVWFEGSVSPLTANTMFWIARDITERKRAEDDLRRQTEILQTIFDHIPVMINFFGADGRLKLVNRAWERTLGWTLEEIRQKNLDIFSECYPDPHDRQKVLNFVAESHGEWAELKTKVKDGRVIETTWAVVHLSDGTSIGIGEDITERRQLLAQLLHSQKMEAIGRLAGGIAHDLNNLLTAIAGYGDFAVAQLQADDPVRRDIEQSLKACDRAAALTRQLLAFSRKQILQPKVLDLNSVVAETEKMLRRLIGEHIGLRTSLEPELGSIKADPGQLEQVIVNLAVNARDAMPRGGQLTIETRNVILDEEYASSHIDISPGNYVMLVVSDTGIGMDEETQRRIFEPFFTTKEAGKGTGLGLSTVFGIVEQSGGHIQAASASGKGTTFSIYFPRIAESAQVYKPGREAEEGLRGSETILLAEDDEMVRGLFSRLLKSYGYQVLETANGEAALLMCERHHGPVHLLLTDVIMPEMSGRELANRLAQLRPEMKVLYVSGYTDDAVIQQGIMDAEVPFLQKPVPQGVLARKVREVLDAPKK